MHCDVPPVLLDIFNYIDAEKDNFIANLKEVVEIPSVATDPTRRQDCIFIVNWMSEKMIEYGIEVEINDLGNEVLPNGKIIKFPPYITAKLGDDINKKTVLIYSHLDVAPAFEEEGWQTEPFTLVEKDGKLYGRGASDSKGPALAWLHAIEAYKSTGTELPVNLKFLFLGMEEIGKSGLEKRLQMKETFWQDIDFVCVSDCLWLSKKTPCITYGLRGLDYFCIEICCAKKDLHSGHHGGSVQDPMGDLMYLFNRLVDSEGNIIIPGAYDNIEPVTLQEERMYSKIDYNIVKFQDRFGSSKLKYSDKGNSLMNRWRVPSLSIHGVEGAYSKAGYSAIIPKKVIGKFSIRVVANQDPENISKLVIDYLDELWKARKSPNEYKTFLGKLGLCKPWVSSVYHDNYKAAWRAIKYVYNIEPDMIRHGGTIPIIVVLQELTKTNIVVLPIGAGDDCTHAQNEKIDVRNFIGGTKVMAAYLYEVSL